MLRGACSRATKSRVPSLASDALGPIPKSGPGLPVPQPAIFMTALFHLLFNLLLRPVADAGDSQLLSLSGVASCYGLVECVLPSGAIHLRSQAVNLKFEPDSRRLVFNGITVWMHEPAVQHAGRLSIHRCDAVSILDPLFRPDRVFLLSERRVVVLDPGHGGTDSGALGSFLSEKDLTLSLASKVEFELSAAGIETFLTRTNDVSIGLRDRAEFAAEHKADVFVSIHANWAENRNASGLETFLLPSAASASADSPSSNATCDAANMLLAYEIHRMTLSETLTTDRGIKRARFEVLRNAECAATLVECGFLSNPIEERALSDESYRWRVARGIAAGIISFLSTAGISR